MDGPAKHLTFGGSSAYRWLRCAGSVQLCATLPPQVENSAMREGTHAHALLEQAVSSRIDNVADFDGALILPGYKPLTGEDCGAVQVALDYVNDLLDRTPDHDLRVEQQVTLLADVGGTADVMIYDPAGKVLHVIDYKHGRGKYVEADNNPQLKLYAAAAMFSSPDFEIHTVKATIIQPRCQFGEPIRTAVYGSADLMVYGDEVEAAVAAALKPNPVFTPGEEQCHWCPAGHVCPALRDASVATVTLPPEGENRLPQGDEVKLILPAPGSCRDPAVLAETLRAATVLKDWIGAIEDAAEAIALSGQELPGFKLVERRPSRKWTDEAEARKWTEANTMLDLDDYAPRSLRSVAQMEKLVKAELGADGVKAMAQHVTKESSGLKLVPNSVKGDAINPLALAAAGFAAAITLD